jgi:hypothetical protein
MVGVCGSLAEQLARPEIHEGSLSGLVLASLVSKEKGGFLNRERSLTRRSRCCVHFMWTRLACDVHAFLSQAEP